VVVDVRLGHTFVNHPELDDRRSSSTFGVVVEVWQAEGGS
jgi:hypothetical protein